MRRRLKPLSARFTRVLFLSLIRSSFLVAGICSSFLNLSLVLDNLSSTVVAQFFFFDFLHFQFDGHYCLLICRPNFTLLHLSIAVAEFQFHLNRYLVVHFSSTAKRMWEV